MTEPRIEGSLSDLTFRSSAHPTPVRSVVPVYFWIGVAIFLSVALVYPFYSYRVHSYLGGREVAAAMAGVTEDISAMANQAQRRSEAAASRASAQAAAERRRRVQVAGTTIISGTRIAIVQLGDASLREAKETICREAAARFREPLAGERLRVQRHRGSLPAVDIGTITCD